MNNNEFNSFGEQVKKVVDSAISSGDFTELSRSIGDVVNNTIDTMKTSANPYSSTYKRSYRPPIVDEPKVEVVKVKKPYTTKPKGAVSGTLMMIAGIGMMLVWLPVTAAGIGSLILSKAIMAGVSKCVIGGGFTAASALLTGAGAKRYALADRFRTYLPIIKDRVCIPVNELSQAVNKNASFVMKDLNKMIGRNYLTQAYIDKDNEYLVLTDSAIQDYKEQKSQYELVKSAKQEALANEADESVLPPECQKIIEEGAQYLKLIQTRNAQIPDPSITEKLYHMENIVSDIFNHLKEHPEVAPDLKKMMDYYLPTTAKLLDTYRSIDDQTVSGENIINTKNEINEAIGALNNAYEKLFDSLFEDIAWDISSDISVLKTVIAQDGLNETEL